MSKLVGLVSQIVWLLLQVPAMGLLRWEVILLSFLGPWQCVTCTLLIEHASCVTASAQHLQSHPQVLGGLRQHHMLRM